MGLVVLVVLENASSVPTTSAFSRAACHVPCHADCDAFHAVGWHEGVAEDFLGRLANAVHAAGALD